MTEPIDLQLARVKRTDDNTEITPSNILRYALAEIETGTESPDRLMILHWSEAADEGEEGIRTGWYAANMRSSEMIALMEMVKAQILRDMGLT